MQLSTESFDLGVEGFCRGISLMVEEIIEDLTLSFEDSCGHSVEVLVIKFRNLIKPFSETFLTRRYGGISLAEYHSQAMSQTIGGFDVRVALEQKFGSGLLAFCPFLGRNRQQIATAGQKFRESIPVRKTLRLILLVNTVGFSASV